MTARVEEFVRSLGVDAYLVGGAVRDELLGRPSKDADFLVRGLGDDSLRTALAPHGRVEELEVAGRRVGLRLVPRERRLREAAPAGIEFAPPRTERSTGPGRHDFEIVADPFLPVEDDLRRRDFTVNAIARRLADGTLLDPFGGRDDLRRGVLRTVTPRSFSEDPLRIVRGLRFVSELGLVPDESTLGQMREHAPGVALVSGERIGGGLAADGLGELSRLLLGSRPLEALRLARDTGVLVVVLPEYGPSIGLDQQNSEHELTLDEHMFVAVQATVAAARPLRVRLAALLHDLGKPHAPDSHEEAGSALAAAATARLRYPSALCARVRAIVRHHTLDLSSPEPLDARRLLARHGQELAFDLVDHREADLRAKRALESPPPADALAPAGLFRMLLERERRQPYRLRDLALGGRDLLALGVSEGPAIGEVLQTLLCEVVEDPSLNRKDRLEDRARELLGR